MSPHRGAAHGAPAYRAPAAAAERASVPRGARTSPRGGACARVSRNRVVLWRGDEERRHYAYLRHFVRGRSRDTRLTASGITELRLSGGCQDSRD
jgi:hypothetical protein